MSKGRIHGMMDMVNSMHYIILDLEFNQPYSFTNGEKTVLVEECPFEIIQMGMVRMSEDFTVTDTGNFYVKPRIYDRVHPFVERITGLTDEILKDQPFFPNALAEAVRFIGEGDHILCVWGSNDIKLLFRNLLYYELDPGCITNRYINVQALASRYLNKPPGAAIGLKNAVELLNIQIDTQFHDALNDAIYTARIFNAVRGDIPAVQSFDVESLSSSGEQKKNKNYVFNTSMLYTAMEKEWGRKLSRKEKNMYKKAYRFGRERKFDFYQP